MDKDGFIVHEFLGSPLISVIYYGKEAADKFHEIIGYINLRKEGLRLTIKDDYKCFIATREDSIIIEYQNSLNNLLSVLLPKMVLCQKEDVEKIKKQLIASEI